MSQKSETIATANTVCGQLYFTCVNCKRIFRTPDYLVSHRCSRVVRARRTVTDKYPNLIDFTINPTFYQPIKNGGRAAHYTLNRWTLFWNMTGARNHTYGQDCIICGHPIRKHRKVHRVCPKHRQLYLQMVKRGEIKPAYFSKLGAITCSV